MTMSAKTKILLVDDEDHIRAFLKALLRQSGDFEVIESRNGEEAIEMLRSKRPDAVMMDINMPNLDGVAALQKMREFDTGTVIIMLTAKATDYAVRECMHSGASNFIRKDTPKEQIVEILRTTLADHGHGRSE